jgi:prevent-host-death family protein
VGPVGPLRSPAALGHTSLTVRQPGEPNLRIDRQIAEAIHLTSRTDQSMRSVGAYDLKTHASALLDAAERGETITVTRRGVPIAQLVPIKRARAETVDAVARWKERRRRIPALSIAEVLSMRDEGRRAK